jgi:hypothetical protein
MHRTFAALLGLIAFLAPSPATAQESGEFVLGGGVGGSYYCIITRCDTGTLLRLTAGYSPRAPLMIEAGFQSLGCFDCDRFRIFEGGLQLRYPGSAVQPFVAAGIHRSSDPGFMGSRTGPYVGVGAWVGSWSRFVVALEVRGRDFGSGDRMGEATVVVARRVGP